MRIMYFCEKCLESVKGCQEEGECFFGKSISHFFRMSKEAKAGRQRQKGAEAVRIKKSNELWVRM